MRFRVPSRMDLHESGNLCHRKTAQSIRYHGRLIAILVFPPALRRKTPESPPDIFPDSPPPIRLGFRDTICHIIITQGAALRSAQFNLCPISPD